MCAISITVPQNTRDISRLGVLYQLLYRDMLEIYHDCVCYINHSITICWRYITTVCAISITRSRYAGDILRLGVLDESVYRDMLEIYQGCVCYKIDLPRNVGDILTLCAM